MSRKLWICGTQWRMGGPLFTIAEPKTTQTNDCDFTNWPLTLLPQVLQRDVECHGRIVSSVVRVCAGDAARALERRWHLLYLRAIEWQCHLEACLARIDNQVSKRGNSIRWQLWNTSNRGGRIVCFKPKNRRGTIVLCQELIKLLGYCLTRMYCYCV